MEVSGLAVFPHVRVGGTGSAAPAETLDRPKEEGNVEKYSEPGVALSRPKCRPIFFSIFLKKTLDCFVFFLNVSAVAESKQGSHTQTRRGAEMELSLAEMDLEQSEYLPNREVMCAPYCNPCQCCCPTLSVEVCVRFCL